MIEYPAESTSSPTEAKRPCEKYQFEDHMLVACWRNPVGDELAIQHWRQKWSGKKVSEEILQGTASHHHAARAQLRCDDVGMTIVFDSGTGEVFSIVEHARP